MGGFLGSVYGCGRASSPRTARTSDERFAEYTIAVKEVCELTGAVERILRVPPDLTLLARIYGLPKMWLLDLWWCERDVVLAYTFNLAGFADGQAGLRPIVRAPPIDGAHALDILRERRTVHHLLRSADGLGALGELAGVDRRFTLELDARPHFGWLRVRAVAPAAVDLLSVADAGERAMLLAAALAGSDAARPPVEPAYPIRLLGCEAIDGAPTVGAARCPAKRARAAEASSAARPAARARTLASIKAALECARFRAIALAPSGDEPALVQALWQDAANEADARAVVARRAAAVHAARADAAPAWRGAPPPSASGATLRELCAELGRATDDCLLRAPARICARCLRACGANQLVRCRV